MNLTLARLCVLRQSSVFCGQSCQEEISDPTLKCSPKLEHDNVKKPWLRASMWNIPSSKNASRMRTGRSRPIWLGKPGWLSNKLIDWLMLLTSVMKSHHINISFQQDIQIAEWCDGDNDAHDWCWCWCWWHWLLMVMKSISAFPFKALR